MDAVIVRSGNGRSPVWMLRLGPRGHGQSVRGISFNSGFTILEMLISALVMAVAVVALLSVFSIALRADSNVERSAVALVLAKNEIELIKNAGSWEAIDDFVSPRTNLGGDFAGFDKEVLVSGDPKEVRVIIYWRTLGFDQTLRLATLFTNYNY